MRWSGSSRKRWAACPTRTSTATRPNRHRRGKPAEEGPKKGKVFRIHGADVFIDLPGGRSAGRAADVAVPRRAAGPRHRGGRPHRGLRQRQRRAYCYRARERRSGRLGERGRRHDRRGPRHGDQQGRPGGGRQRHPRLHADQPDRPVSRRGRRPSSSTSGCVAWSRRSIRPSATSSSAGGRCWRRSARRTARSCGSELAEGQIREGIVRSVQGLRRLRGPGRRGRPDPRQRDELAARAGSVGGGAAGPDGQGGGAQDRPRAPQGQPRPEAVDGQPVGQHHREVPHRPAWRRAR